jgi:hypothetical protein
MNPALYFQDPRWRLRNTFAPTERVVYVPGLRTGVRAARGGGESSSSSIHPEVQKIVDAFNDPNWDKWGSDSGYTSDSSVRTYSEVSYSSNSLAAYNSDLDAIDRDIDEAHRILDSDSNSGNEGSGLERAMVYTKKFSKRVKQKRKMCKRRGCRIHPRKGTLCYKHRQARTKKKKKPKQSK